MDFIKSLIPYFPKNYDTMSLELFSMIDYYRISENIRDDFQGFRGYQKVIQLLFKPETHLKHVLLKHTPGSGKTRTALGIIINFIFQNKKSIYVITPNRSQISNLRKIFLDSLKDLKEYNDEEILIIKNYINEMKIISFLDIDSITKFLNNIPDLIIMDEVHIIHYKQEDKLKKFNDIKDGLNIYTQIKYVFNSLLNKKTKIILMTGTPIVHNYLKLFEIMDLILPPELQFNSKRISDLDDEIIDYLKLRFNGRTSSVNIKFETIKEIYFGEYLNKKTLKKVENKTKSTFSIPLFFDITIGYQNKKINDLKNKKEYNSEDIFFAFPENMNYKNTISEEKSKKIEWKNTKLKSDIKNPQFLKEHSILYYNMLGFIGGLIDNKNNKEAIFYFNSLNKTVGNKLFSLILRSYGMKEIKDSSTINKIKNEVDMNIDTKNLSNPYKRFAVITSNFGINNDEQINNLVYIFSHVNNRYGKYLKLIIGSEKMTISYNLINGRQVHIILQNNNSIMEQAIARIIRGTSNFSIPEESYAKIYRHFISSDIITKKDDFYIRLVNCENNLNMNNNILSIFEQSSLDYYINRKINNIDAPNIILNSLINFENINVKNNIINFLNKLFIFQKFCYLKDIQDKLNITYVETLYYLSKLIMNKKLFNGINNIIKPLTFFRNILFLGDTNDISELFFKTKLFKHIDHFELDQYYLLKSFNFEEFKIKLNKGENLINDYLKFNIFVRILIFESLILGNYKNKYAKQFRELLIKAEYDKFIIFDESIKVSFKFLNNENIKVAHILLCNHFNINFNIKNGMRIFVDSKWLYLHHKELTMTIHKEIQNKTKMNIPNINIPFDFIFVKKGNELVRLKNGDFSKKGRKCKTLDVGLIDSYKKELNDYILKNNIKIKDNFILDKESNIDYIYRIQQQIIHILNPDTEFDL